MLLSPRCRIPAASIRNQAVPVPSHASSSQGIRLRQKHSDVPSGAVPKLQKWLTILKAFLHIAGGQPYVLGLTGSIGMGKTTIGKLFEEMSVQVQSADDIVHGLYAQGGAGVDAVRGLFPDAIVNESVDRAKLSKHVIGADNKQAMQALEAAVHPLVEQARLDFIRQNGEAGERLVVVDVPLLFEKKMEDKVDAVLVVSAPAEIQRERVLSRSGMTAEKFDAILAKQVPDSAKRDRAHFVIETNKDLNYTRIEVAELVHRLASAAAA